MEDTEYSLQEDAGSDTTSIEMDRLEPIEEIKLDNGSNEHIDIDDREVLLEYIKSLTSLVLLLRHVQLHGLKRKQLSGANVIHRDSLLYIIRI